MTHEPFFSLPAVAAPTVLDTMVPAPVVISPVATMNENEEPVLQDSIEPIATHEGEQQQPQIEDVPNVKAPSRSQRVRKSAISADYEVYNTKEFQMEDEMKSMNVNKVWDLEIIPKGVKTVGCKWVYKTKHDSQGNIKTYKV